MAVFISLDVQPYLPCAQGLQNISLGLGGLYSESQGLERGLQHVKCKIHMKATIPGRGRQGNLSITLPQNAEQV